MQTWRNGYRLVPKGCYEIRMSQRQTPQIFCNGYSYGIKSRSGNRTRYWRCTLSRKCKASAIANDDGSLLVRESHCH